MPEEIPENPALKSTDGKTVPLQISDDGTATFILPELSAGKSASYELVSLPDAMTDIALAEEKDGAVTFAVGGKAVGSFIGEAADSTERQQKSTCAAEYLHPLATPTGNVVTDDYPANHLHHHGVWTAWTNTVFQGRKTDFWNMGQGLGKG